MHETAKIILKPPDMRLDSGALMGSKLHIERVQSFSLRPGDKKPENSKFYERFMWFHRFLGRNRQYLVRLGRIKLQEIFQDLEGRPPRIKIKF